MTTSLQTELETFAAHKDELIGKAKGKFALIKGDKILGVYETQADAASAGYRDLGNVPFLVKKIEELEMPMNFSSYKIAI